MQDSRTNLSIVSFKLSIAAHFDQMIKTFPPFMLPILFLLWALLLRLPVFGANFLGGDETWYLYVGHCLTQGYWPYIDLFDRKPVGLFLLYAFFSLFGSYEFWVYQVFALFCVGSTSFLIYKIACLSASKNAAFCGALLYAPFLNYCEGHGGQSPVFFNLLTCFSFYLVLSKWECLKRSYSQLLAVGSVAMALFGLALQIKYTVVFEGVFLGLFLLALAWQPQEQLSCQTRLMRTSAAAALWVGCALLPTLFAFSFYAFHGHAHEWIFANIQSVLLRSQHIEKSNLHRTLKLIAIGLSLSFGLFLTLRHYQKTKSPETVQPRILIFILIWSIVSLCAALIPGEWYDHYFLPCFIPFSIAAGILCAFNPCKIIALITGISLIIAYQNTHARWYGMMSIKQHDVEILNKRIETEGKGCLWNVTGFSFLSEILPHKNCRLSPIAFGYHWRDSNEFNALGISLPQEFEHIEKIHPRYILTSPGLDFQNPKTPSEKLQHDIFSFVQKNYQPFILWRVDWKTWVEEPWILWKIKSGIPYDQL